jgi:hypothetical protein
MRYILILCKRFGSMYKSFSLHTSAKYIFGTLVFHDAIGVVKRIMSKLT